jgi:hypothetical protein
MLKQIQPDDRYKKAIHSGLLFCFLVDYYKKIVIPAQAGILMQ